MINLESFETENFTCMVTKKVTSVWISDTVETIYLNLKDIYPERDNLIVN